MRGKLSQGLVQRPFEVDGLAGYLIQKHNAAMGSTFADFEGTDVSEFLGVIKYEPPIPACLSGLAKGHFPGFVSKTDQERAQNLEHEIFVDHADDFYEVTVKLDGSSMTAYYLDGEVGVCSRNLEMKICDENKSNTFVRLFYDTGLESALRAVGRNIAVQGEAMGPGIQGNREKLQKPTLFVFDIYDIEKHRNFTPDERRDTMKLLYFHGFSGEHVPVEHNYINLPPMPLDELLELANGPSLNHPIREGLVFKSHNSPFSFKVISNRFLLKGGE